MEPGSALMGPRLAGYNLGCFFTLLSESVFGCTLDEVRFRVRGETDA